MADSAFLALIGINKFRVFSRLILFDPLLRHQNDPRGTGASRIPFSGNTPSALQFSDRNAPAGFTRLARTKGT